MLKRVSLLGRRLKCISADYLICPIYRALAALHKPDWHVPVVDWVGAGSCETIKAAVISRISAGCQGLDKQLMTCMCLGLRYQNINE